MIELIYFEIENFKSLNNFKLNFSKFSCLIGLNSSGKSTILQAIDFISQQMNGDIKGWLKKRGWEANHIDCKLTREKNILAIITFKYNNKKYSWGFSFNPILLKCTYEVLVVGSSISKAKPSETIFKIQNSKYYIDMGNKKLKGDIIQDYEGSFLSNLKPELLPEVIKEFKEYIKNIYSLDLLSPQELRKRSRVGEKLGLSGEFLSAFLNKLDKKQQENLLIHLQKCYSNIDKFSIRKSKGGWTRLEVVENFSNDKKLISEAKYLNDGILRLIAILAQLETKKSFLLFDEIENGINSELIEFLLDTLIDSNHQVMITSHSPMILNYIEDEVAMKSVHYIYKTKEGFTKSIPFFDIPSMKEKLEMMGAGSVYVDTNLDDLVEEIEEVNKSKK